MTVKESLLFRGAMQIEQPRMTCDVMLIASQLDHYELFYGAGTMFNWANSSWSRSNVPPIKRGSFLTRRKWRSISPEGREHFL